MSDRDRLKIISVTGAHSGVGKTTLCTILLKELQGYGAVKVTNTGGEKEEGQKKKAERISKALLIDDPVVIKEEGKDTAIMHGSGAERVLWIKSPKGGLEEILPVALERMKGLKGVVVEGNSSVDFLNTHLVIFIVGEDGMIKPSSFDVAKIADIIVVNTGNRATGPSDTIVLPEGKAERFRIDLNNREGEIDEFISCVKDRIA